MRLWWRTAALVAVAAVVIVGGYLALRFVQVGAPGTPIGRDVLAEDDLILVVDLEHQTDDSLLGAGYQLTARVVATFAALHVPPFPLPRRVLLNTASVTTTRLGTGTNATHGGAVLRIGSCHSLPPTGAPTIFHS